CLHGVRADRAEPDQRIYLCDGCGAGDAASGHSRRAADEDGDRLRRRLSNPAAEKHVVGACLASDCFARPVGGVACEASSCKGLVFYSCSAASSFSSASSSCSSSSSCCRF